MTSSLVSFTSYHKLYSLSCRLLASLPIELTHMLWAYECDKKLLWASTHKINDNTLPSFYPGYMVHLVQDWEWGLSDFTVRNKNSTAELASTRNTELPAAATHTTIIDWNQPITAIEHCYNDADEVVPHCLMESPRVNNKDFILPMVLVFPVFSRTASSRETCCSKSLSSDWSQVRASLWVLSMCYMCMCVHSGRRILRQSMQLGQWYETTL